MKNASINLSFLGACAALAFTFTAPARAVHSPRAEIETATKQLLAAAAKGDAAGVAAAFAVDGQVLPPDSEPIKGRAAIQEYYEGVLNSGVATAEDKILEVYSQGSYATVVGEGLRKDQAGKVIFRGKFIVIWKRDGQSWEVFRDMFSGNMKAT